MKMELDRIWENDIYGLLESARAIQKGHFVGTSGRHLDTYIDKDALGVDTPTMEKLAFELAHRLDDRLGLASGKKKVDAIIGAPMGAIALASRVAFHLGSICAKDGKFLTIPSLYAEKTGDGNLRIRGAFVKHLKNGADVISIEDILNTGGTAEEMLRVIREVGGNPIAVGAICNRGGVTNTNWGKVEIVSLLNLNLNSFPASECPLCTGGVPIRTDLGHGAKFLAEQRVAPNEQPK